MGGDICNRLTFTASTEAKHTIITSREDRLVKNKTQVQETTSLGMQSSSTSLKI